MRKLNFKVLLCLVSAMVLFGGTIAFAHHLQFKRIPKALLEQAQRAEDQGDLARTDQFLSRYLEFAPQDLDQRARLARILADPKRARGSAARFRAYAELEKVLARDPERHDLRRLVVPLALELDRLKDAGQHLEALQKAFPRDGAVASLWGQWHERSREYDQALTSYRQAIEFAPQQVEDYQRLATLLHNRPWPNRTAEQATRSRKAAMQEADKVMATLIKNNPESWQARVARWNYLRDRHAAELKQPDSPLLKEAIGDIEKGLALAEGQPDVRLAAAEVALIQNQAQTARAHLDKAMQLYRDDARLYRTYAQVEFQSVDPKTVTSEQKVEVRNKAYDWLRRGIKELKGYNQQDVMWSFVTLLIDSGSPEELQEAEGLIKRLRMTGFSPAGVDFLQARLLLGRQQWSEAARLFERARPLMDAAPEVASQIDLYLGQCYGQLEDPNQQYAAYRRLATRDPGSVQAYLGLANAARALGRLPEAMEHYKTLTRIDKAPVAARSELIQLMIVEARQKRDATSWDQVDQAIKAVEKASSDPVEPILLRAEYLVAREKPDEARNLLLQAQQKDPNNVRLWTARATLAQKQRDPTEALRILDEAEKSLAEAYRTKAPTSSSWKSDLVELRLQRANYWVNQNNAQTKTELARLVQGIEQFDGPDLDRLLNGLANYLYRANQIDDAMRLWTQLAERPSYSGDLRLRLVLFDLSLQQGRTETMDRVLEQIRTIEGGEGTYGRHTQALKLIWMVKQNKLEGQERTAALEQAARLLSQVRGARPGWSAVLLASAEIEELRGQPDQAINHYKQALHLGERNPLVIRQLVTALRKQNRNKEADDELRRLSHSDLLAADLQRLAAEVSLRNNDPDRAVRLAMETVRNDSRDYRDHLWLGQVLSASKQRPEEAERHLRRAIELGGNEVEPWSAMVEFLVAQKRTTEVETLLQQLPTRMSADKRDLALAHCYVALTRPDEAAKSFAAALKDHPTDARVLMDYSQFELQRGKLAEAETLLRKFLQEGKGANDADLEWASIRLAVLLSATDDYERFKEALPYIGLTLDGNGKLTPDRRHVKTDSLELQRTRARVLATQSQGSIRDEAIRQFEELDRRQAITSDDRFILARLYENKGTWPRAREHLRQLVLARDVKLSHLSYYIQSLLKQQELAEARRLLDKLREAEKAHPTPGGDLALTELEARWLEANKQGDKAIALLRKRLALTGSDPQEILLLVATLGRQKKFAEAIQMLDEVWKRCPVETAGGASVALLRSFKGTDADRKPIEQRLRRAIEHQPKSAMLRVQLGDLQDLCGNYEEAESLYRQALEIEPRNVMALNNLAWLLGQRLRKGDDALALINRAIGVVGPRGELLDTRAVVYLTLNRPADALSDLQEAIKEAPTPTRYFHLARAHHQANDRDAAKVAMHQARQLGLQAAQLHPVEQVVFTTLSREFNAE